MDEIERGTERDWRTGVWMETEKERERRQQRGKRKMRLVSF